MEPDTIETLISGHQNQVVTHGTHSSARKQTQPTLYVRFVH